MAGVLKWWEYSGRCGVGGQRIVAGGNWEMAGTCTYETVVGVMYVAGGVQATYICMSPLPHPVRRQMQLSSHHTSGIHQSISQSCPQLPPSHHCHPPQHPSVNYPCFHHYCQLSVTRHEHFHTRISSASASQSS